MNLATITMHQLSEMDFIESQHEALLSKHITNRHGTTGTQKLQRAEDEEVSNRYYC